MKKLLFCMSIIILAGCNKGGGGDSPTSPSSAPSISNLQYSPHSASLGQGGGAVTMTGTFDAMDADADIISLTGKDGAGCPNPGETNTLTLPSSNGAIAVTYSLGGTMPTTSTYTCATEIWVTDSKGNNSNKLTSTFTVN